MPWAKPLSRNWKGWSNLYSIWLTMDARLSPLKELSDEWYHPLLPVTQPLKQQQPMITFNPMVNDGTHCQHFNCCKSPSRPLWHTNTIEHHDWLGPAPFWMMNNMVPMVHTAGPRQPCTLQNYLSTLFTPDLFVPAHILHWLATQCPANTCLPNTHHAQTTTTAFGST